MNNATATTAANIHLGSVYTAPKSRRRWLAVVQDQFGRFEFVALAGAQRGSQICNAIPARDGATMLTHSAMNYGNPMQTLSDEFIATIPVIQGATRGRNAK